MPRQADTLIPRACPFKIEDGDPADAAGLNGGEDFGMTERAHISVALQPLLCEVHRVRNVDRQHQFEIDINRSSCRRGGRDCSHGGRQRDHRKQKGQRIAPT